jgi:mono/diheme cytochrome c family protein
LGGARFEGMNIGGASNMPAFGSVLSDEEITAVLTYIKSTWPEETRTTQWEVTVMTENQ